MPIASTKEIATLEQAKQLGLLEEEFIKIKDILEREPNFTELAIFSAMWSEHCSYKNSILWLKKLPKEGPMILAEAGEENAGLIDIGEGLACCFKIESHNHPSALEPFQGAATGVGGINRDIFGMGARPIANLNSLRFGNPKTERTKHLIKGVVKGISSYGNSFGIPTVGGEVYFDDCYETNILVNAMSVGIVEKGKTASAVADGVGNPVFIYGSSTGKDGIHGASFASKDIGEDAMDDLPAVQVGDPFWEKLLLEATLELINADIVVGIQDMGAAGICCSSSEMSAKSKTGMDIDLGKVPLRQSNMRDWEILLSESQERMLVVIEKGKEDKAVEILTKWDLTYAEIGRVTDSQKVRYFVGEELVADIPADSLVLGGGAPVYEREFEEPKYLSKINQFDIAQIPDENIKDAGIFLLKQPNIASKKWVYQQYDSMVGTINQSTNKKSDASVVKIEGTDSSLAMTVDCNSRYIFANPRKGTAIAVAEAARNITVSGGVPSGVTNCLNFGNPYDKEVYWQFKEAILGMKDACLKFNTPVTGGNVSFYNQSGEGTAVYPTPTIGMVGLIEKQSHITGLGFIEENNLIYILGKEVDDLGSSQYLAKYHGIDFSPCPYFDLEEEYALHQTIRHLIKDNLVHSLHDISEGGVFISLCESSFENGIGFDVETNPHVRKDACLFGEAQGRVIASISSEKQENFEKILLNNNIDFRLMGMTKGQNAMIDQESFGEIQELKNMYDNALSETIGLF